MTLTPSNGRLPLCNAYPPRAVITHTDDMHSARVAPSDGLAHSCMTAQYSRKRSVLAKTKGPGHLYYSAHAAGHTALQAPKVAPYSCFVRSQRQPMQLAPFLSFSGRMLSRAWGLLISVQLTTGVRMLGAHPRWTRDTYRERGQTVA